MSLVFDNFNSAIPQTHVFIIGVGSYPYLTGGALAPQDPVFADDNLGQLTSPPISSKRIYDTIMDIHENNGWIKPLGSIELAISSATDFFPNLQVQTATRQNISAGFNNWQARCQSSRENVALFFFCGHGLENGEHYLLAEDFGGNLDNPWDGAFAFDLTRRAFHQCRAETQLFFVDACRQVTPEMLTQDLTIAPLKQPSILTPECKYNLTIKATAANEGAYSRPNQPSFFTQAILKAFNGYASFREDGDDWKISTTNIAARINQLVKTIEPSQSYPQRCNYTCNDSANIIRLATPPSVDVEVSCQPDEALAHASLSYTNLDFEDNSGSRDPLPQPWLVALEAGIYKLGATFQAADFKNASKHVSVMPPFTKEKINVL